MQSKTHEELLLGNALEVILQEEQRNLPVISEYQFQREVLDILENPFGADALRHYAVYVGELTKPLKVVSNHDRNQVLFTVPALVQSPTTTVALGQGITAENFMRSLTRDIDLGGKYLNEKIFNFLMRLTKTPDYRTAVIEPIQAILARYGRQMKAFAPTTSVTPVDTDPTPSSFEDEYVD